MAEANRLPETPEGFREAKWEDVLPFYEELAQRELGGSNVEQWLLDWSKFEELLGEASTLAEYAYARNTADAGAEAAQKRFGEEIKPKAEEQRVRLQKRLVDLGYVRAGLEMMVKEFRNGIELFRSANVPLEAALSGLETEWAKVNGDLSVFWEGLEYTPEALTPFLLDPNREVRERAFKLKAKPYSDKKAILAEIFDQMYDLRGQVARNAGFANYRDYVHQAMRRFDYSPQDCLRFHAAVEEVVKPAAERILERRRQQMGLERLKPWDLAVDAQGRAGLKPFTDIETFIVRAGRMLSQVDESFGAAYESLVKNDLLDLDNRKGKAPGGFCAELPWCHLALIFMNAVGVDEDVRTLLHESGHALHAIEAGHWPLIFQRTVGNEMAEVASMSMELLAAPFLSRTKGGFYSEEEAVRSETALLEDIILLLPHCASVDAFQQWAYTTPEGANSEAREAKWLELRRRFEGESVDWSGLEEERVARWYQQPHFFTNPFYYIEYGIAQLGALQVWRQSKQDPQAAVNGYRQALALGGTQPLPALFAAAGAKLVFDAAQMGELVRAVEEELAGLELRAGVTKMEGRRLEAEEDEVALH
jgi:oligoendopeptidase F